MRRLASELQSVFADANCPCEVVDLGDAIRFESIIQPVEFAKTYRGKNNRRSIWRYARHIIETNTIVPISEKWAEFFEMMRNFEILEPEKC